MEHINKNNIEIDALPGRGLIRAVGKNSQFSSDAMTVGYALYSREYGVMEPHHHAEETVLITAVKDGWVEWGDDPNALTDKLKLEVGTVLHIPANEWHVFKYDEGGFVEIVFIYAGTDNVRPEDNK